MNEVIKACIVNSSMTGVSGSISFMQDADPVRIVTIERIQGKNIQPVCSLGSPPAHQRNSIRKMFR